VKNTRRKAVKSWLGEGALATMAREALSRMVMT
jgi:hypothetical protein